MVEWPLAGCLTTEEGEDLRAVFAGIGDDRKSSYRAGAAGGPEAIRRFYNGDCYNSTSDSGVDLEKKVLDLGDLGPESDWDTDAIGYGERLGVHFAQGRTVFVAGGDHAVTVAVVGAAKRVGRPIHVVQLDAHPDLYPEFDGDARSHACVATRLLETNHVKSLTQIGVRTWNRVERQTAERFRSRLTPLEAIGEEDSVYVTLDLDVFEPAFAPGVGHPVPGGLSPREVLDWLADLPGQLIGMDVVELNPSLDPQGLTAVLAGRLLHQGMARAYR